MFLTGQIANPLIAELAGGSGCGDHLGKLGRWPRWFPVWRALVVIPLFIYLIYPPETKRTPDAVEIARRELTRMAR